MELEDSLRLCRSFEQLTGRDLAFITSITNGRKCNIVVKRETRYNVTQIGREYHLNETNKVLSLTLATNYSQSSNAL